MEYNMGNSQTNAKANSQIWWSRDGRKNRLCPTMKAPHLMHSP